MLTRCARRLAILLIVVTALAVRPRPAFACSCVWPPPDPPAAFAQYTAVFSGQVTGIADTGSIPFLSQLRQWLGLHLPYGRSVVFRVIDSWKGVATRTVGIRTGYGDADCGYAFAIGAQYLVYAFQGSMYAPQGQAELETGICTRTAEIALATPDLTYLQTQPKLALAPAKSGLLPVYAGLAVVLVALLSISAWWFRRKRASAENPKPNS
ncbi:MAG: hypothetical protein ACRDH2_11825 [Anaerolineales bacterium]